MFLASIALNGGLLSGPDPNDLHVSPRLFSWKRTLNRVCKLRGRRIARWRLARAEALGLMYRQDTLEITERDFYLRT
jgi:hypothetical protein